MHYTFNIMAIRQCAGCCLEAPTKGFIRFKVRDNRSFLIRQWDVILMHPNVMIVYFRPFFFYVGRGCLHIACSKINK